MRLSVIIPVYNVSDYIERCLRSVVEQNFYDMECIIVDDCGTDDSMAKVHEFVARSKSPISFKILHHKKNRGQSAARNTAVEVAQGDYIFFLDSDDELTEGALRQLFGMIQRYGPVDVVQSIYSIDGKYVPYFIADKEYYTGNEAKDVYLNNEICLSPCNKLVRSSIAKNIKFIEGIINEDNPWNFHVFMKMESLCWYHKPTYIYYMNPNSTTHNTAFKKRSINSFMVIYDNIIGEMEQMKMNRAFPVRKILDRYVFGFILMPGSDSNTYTDTAKRLLRLYQQNKRHLDFRDYLISRALCIPFPYNIKYAGWLKRFFAIMSRVGLLQAAKI